MYNPVIAEIQTCVSYLYLVLESTIVAFSVKFIESFINNIVSCESTLYPYRQN